jgi:hypothetical protein
MISLSNENLFVHQPKSGMKFMSGSVVEITGVLEHMKPGANDVEPGDF